MTGSDAWISVSDPCSQVTYSGMALRTSLWKHVYPRQRARRCSQIHGVKNMKHLVFVVLQRWSSIKPPRSICVLKSKHRVKMVTEVQLSSFNLSHVNQIAIISPLRSSMLVWKTQLWLVSRESFHVRTKMASKKYTRSLRSRWEGGHWLSWLLLKNFVFQSVNILWEVCQNRVILGYLGG